MKNVDLRVKKGSISYEQLAKHMDLHENTVWKWFNTSSLDVVKRQRLLIAIEEIKAGK